MSDTDCFLRAHRFCNWDSKDRAYVSFVLCVRTCAKGKTPDYRDNKDALYVSDDGFILFNDMLRRLFPRFDWYDDTCLSPSECLKLEAALSGMAEELKQAGDAPELDAVFKVGTAHFASVPIVPDSRLQCV